MNWEEVAPTLTAKQYEVVLWCAHNNSDPRVAVRERIVSEASIDNWKVHNVRAWVSAYRRANPTPEDVVNNIRERLTEMAVPACTVLQGALGGAATSPTTLKTAQWVVNTVLEHLEKAKPSAGQGQNPQEDELRRALRLVGADE